jgi:alcohol dehydrogenase class IV
MLQNIISGKDSYKKIVEILSAVGSKKFFIVCGPSFPFQSVKELYFDKANIPYVRFNGFTPNPIYEDVCNGVDLFNAEGCDSIVAIGGGSTIDVAKCIKLFCKMDKQSNYLQQEYKDSGIPFIAIPTTAGTGSESTRYSVIYFRGSKQSVTHDTIIPNYVILEHSLLKTLPPYQKKCAMLDALCQGIESWWSVNSTDESKRYSKMAVRTIIENMDSYILDNNDNSAEKIMLAANYSGRAINITQTTAAHAMSYKLTSLYKLPHGHAVAVCLPEIWNYMIEHLEKCIDKRGADYLSGIFYEIADAMGVNSPIEAVRSFKKIMSKLQMLNPKFVKKEEDLDILTKSVNPVRLKNNPVELDDKTIYSLYEKIRL